MAMTQVSFNEKREHRKGKIGESIVRRRLERRGWQVTQFTYEMPHVFDMFCHNMKTGQSMAIEVKTKSRFKMYDETGISHYHFVRYRKWIEAHGMEFYLLFVDHIAGFIYGGDFRDLCMKPMNKRGGSVAWPMKYLQQWQELTPEEIQSIENVSEKYDIKPVYNSELWAQLELELRK